ncbi:MAG TPA: L,D-transpeptidase [Solirubrobacteraceae bacterium]|jgi:lipoprotein-anchoring transpeptidase ErfK/SrfK
MTGLQGLLAVLAAAVMGGSVSPQEVVRPVLTPLPPRAPVRTPLPAAVDVGARVVAATALRDAPEGAVVARVRPRTEFGSPRVLPVVRRQGRWLGVIATERANGRLAWVPTARVELVREPVRIDVDLSARELRVVAGGRAMLRMTVGVGSPATPTPTGWFAVTDGLRGWGPYGCCIVALSGHQTRLAQGWTGGDRLAVHGTSAPSTVGAAASLGCLRAAKADMRRLLRIARLGARVHITA